MRFLIFVLGLLFFFSCQNDDKEKAKPNNQAPKSIPVEEVKEIEFKVYIDKLRMRSGSSVEDKVIFELAENTILKYLGESSKHTTKIKLRGMPMDAPWLLVETEKGEKGWIYAGGVKPKTDDPSKAAEIIDEIHFNSFFDKKLAHQIQSFGTNWEAAKTSEEISKLFLESEEIQGQVNDLLSEKIQLDDPMYLPDMGWLERATKVFQTSLVAEGTELFIFQNYKKMHAKALKTDGEADEDFFEFQFKVHETDSIEHFFKAWFLQTWDYGGSSLLGQGTHLALMQEIEGLLAKSKLFEKPILDIKTQILNDILDKHNNYWEPIDKIIDELQNIIQQDFVFLTKENKIALKTRLEMFKNHEANKIEVNQRAF